MCKIKICAFGVREDEKQAMMEYSKQLDVDVLINSVEPSAQNATITQGCLGVTVSGQTYISREILQAYKDNGINYLTTRTRGYNHIDIQAAKELGIHVAAASYPPDSVAEFTIMMMLLCLRNYKQSIWRGQVNDFDLSGLLGKELNQCVVGVLGTGQIGAKVCQLLHGFGCTILASAHHHNPDIEDYVTYVSQEELFRQSDIITLHIPLTDKTYHLINDETLALMKDGVIIINCARGELADNETLVKGIESQKIGALGLDTVEGENGIIHGDHRIEILPNRNLFYLRQFRNVIMTPHMAFFTTTSVNSMVKCGLQYILDMYYNRPINDLIV